MTNISALCTCGCAKTLTNGVLESEKPSLDSKNRPWRTPKHEKNRQDVHKTATKCTKNAQERKKCGQDRKMCQHGPNLQRFRLGFGRFWPSLKAVFPTFTRQWGSTRLALQAARRILNAQILPRRIQILPKPSQNRSKSHPKGLLEPILGHCFKKI